MSTVLILITITSVIIFIFSKDMSVIITGECLSIKDLLNNIGTFSIGFVPLKIKKKN